MKATAEKSSATTSKTTSRSSEGPFFAKAGSSGFFEPTPSLAIPGIQMKTTVNRPGDKFEQEADRMADNVMRMPNPARKDENIQRQPGDNTQKKGEEKIQKKEEERIQKAPTLPEEKVQRAEVKEEKIQKKDDEKIQRKAADGTPSVGTTVQSAIQNQTAGGQALSADVRSYMEPRFGADFSQIRIHNNAESASLSNQLSARAFTYQNHVFFSRDQYQPGTSEGRHLLAHELTHTIQQGHAVQRSPQVSTTTTPPPIQRLGIGDALDFFANAAYNIPGYRMFTIILGVNPINMQTTDRSAANILRAIVEFLPGGNLITRVLDHYGILERAGGFVESQLRGLGITGGGIRSAVMQFLDSLGWRDIFDLGGVWERAKRIFSEPIGRLIDMARSLFTAIKQFVWDAVLRPLAALAAQTRGYDLVKAILGRDPITGDAYPRTAETLIGGFMKLIGQEEVWENIKRGNAIGRAWAWFQGALAELMGFVTSIPTLFIDTLHSLELSDFLPPTTAFGKIFGAIGNFVGNFISWAVSKVISLLEILFSVVAPGAVPYIAKAQAAFRTIIQNPIGFVGNLVQAGKQGFQLFAGNILEHLKTALIKWITGPLGEAGVYIPKSFTLLEIVKLVLSVLGLTWQNIRSKLVKIIPEPVLVVLEKTAGILVTLVKDGPAAAWEQIKAELSELKDQLIAQITQMISTEVVKAAVTKLVSMINPAGAFVQAILAIYNTVTFFIEKISQIGAVVGSFIDSISAIAAGQIAGAAKRVEQTMANTLTVVLAFLAKFAGLGNVPNKVVGIVKRIRQPIDKGLDKIVAWLGGVLKKLGRAVAQAGLPADPNERLKLGMQAAVAVVNRFAGRKVGRLVLIPLLGGIKMRYGFAKLELIERAGKWAIQGTINPSSEQGTNAETGSDNAAGGDDGPRQTTQQISYSMGKRGDRTLKIAQGNLRIVPASQRLRDELVQRKVSGGTGDDAGHLIGNLFGGSGGEENLSPQNWIQNRYGTFRQLERNWHNQLLDGASIWVKVTDVYRAGEDRPFKREVEWRASGAGAQSGELTFMNSHTPRSREMQNIPPTVTSEQTNNVIPVDFKSRQRI